MAKKREKNVMEAALDYISYRMRSESEVRTSLRRKGYEAQEIDEVIIRIKEYGYIDDGLFAKEFVRSKTNTRPTGRKKLRQQMMQAGVDKESLEQALDGYSLEDEQAACDEMFQKLVRSRGNDKAAITKIQRTLLSRGFGYDIIRNSANRFAQGDDAYFDS